MQIITAEISHLPILAPMFDAYREFYQQQAQPEAVRHFLQQRLQNKDSNIFIAMMEYTALGFAQLYPCFSSLGMRRIYILNDLYVAPEYRKQNIGRQLMRAAKEFALNNHATELVLSTEITNSAAQKLYASEGYRKNERFYEYSLNLRRLTVTFLQR